MKKVPSFVEQTIALCCWFIADTIAEAFLQFPEYWPGFNIFLTNSEPTIAPTNHYLGRLHDLGLVRIVPA